MKKLVIVILMAALVAGTVFGQQRFNRGTFNGTARGYAGDVTVAVTFTASRITAINVTEHTETPAFANMVWNNMIPAMVQAQRADVDIVTGATLTSNALIQAVQSAINQARR